MFTLPSGHRRFSESDLLTWLGRGNEQEESNLTFADSVPVAAVIRVSSKGQTTVQGSSDKSSLEHQEERVGTFIKEKWEGRRM